VNTARSTLSPARDAFKVGKYPLQPLRAFRALRRLIADKEDTVQAFEIIDAFSGKAIAAGYQRMLHDSEGARQAYLGEEFVDRLQDKEWLSSCAPGTVGACYREFVTRRDLSVYGLVEDSRKLGNADVDTAHPVAWYARRVRDVHDIWHVLTGYGTDTLGEGCLLGFTYAQTRNGGVGFIAAAGAYELTRSHWYQPYARAIFQGWRLGRKAAWLPALDYVRLFDEPLEAARSRLNLARPTIYESVPVEARGAYRDEVDRELLVLKNSVR
jgi:ubiquinone biosynthesis protein COQ4